jgi:hypothetical protein
LPEAVWFEARGDRSSLHAGKIGGFGLGGLFAADQIIRAAGGVAGRVALDQFATAILG